MAYLLLGVAQAMGLLMILGGWPGSLVQLGALALFAWYTQFLLIGLEPLALLVAVVFIAELARFILAPGIRDPRVKRRAAALSLAAGAAGAGAGAMYPLVGPLFGALAGAFLGSAFAAIGSPPRVEGAAPLAGQLAAEGLRSAAGLSIAIFTLLTLIR